MKLLCGILTALTVLAMTPELSAGGKKGNKASVTFHLETEGTDNPKMIFPQMTNGQTRYFRRSPEITLLDMVSFSPFPADNGESWALDDLASQWARGGRRDDRQAGDGRSHRNLERRQ